MRSPAAVLDTADPAVVKDPYPAYAAQRAAAPMAWHEASGMWLATSHAAASAVLRDRGLGRLWRDREPAERFEPFNLLHRHQMMENEPPEHTRLRRLVASAFSRGHVERLRPRVAQIVDELLDDVVDRSEVDLLATFAEPLPVAVIAELLGVPEADRPLLRPWSNAIVKMYELHRTPQLEAAALVAAEEFAAYVRELARERRERPRDDLLSHLVEASEGEGRLSEVEVVAAAVLLLNAGHEASVNVLGNGVVALLRHPEQLAALRADPDGLAGSAVEEFMRYDTPLHLFERTATRDVEVAGVVVSAGDKVAALLGAANRDPAVFDDPDRFDVRRDPNPHLGFGAGLHFCLGAPLARVELGLALRRLLARCPRLELAAEPVRRPELVIRGYWSVPVRTR